MIRPDSRFSVRFAALAGLLLLLLAAAALADLGQAAAQRVLSVTAYPTAVPARGGQTMITVRIPAAAADAEERVQLSTELGAFTASSGPSEISTALNDVGNEMKGASVRLVADGRAGATVVTARVGSLVDTVTVRFVGEPAELRLLSPAANASLDASRPHQIRVVARDRDGVRVPSAAVQMTLLEAPEGAELRGGGESSPSALEVTTSQSGEAIVSLASSPGDVRLEARSGTALLVAEFRLYGAPTTLRLVALGASAIERGTIGEAGSIQALLLDERKQGVPNRRIRFVAEGGLEVRSDGDGEALVSDDSGRVRVHLDASEAELGLNVLTASWSAGGAAEELTLSDELEIQVTGPPRVMYLVAEEVLSETGDTGEVLIEEYASLTRYRVQAEVLDELGQRVAGAHQVRWRPLVSAAGAHVDPVESTTEDGIATAIFSLEHIDGSPQLDSTAAQAWLVSRAQVNNKGYLSDLLVEGLPLRAGWNSLIWRGPDLPVSIVVDRIRHVVSSAWYQTEHEGWQAWFSGNVPGAVDFTLQTGDRFQLVLFSAARLPNVERPSPR